MATAFSRRRFLCTAAGSISVTFGGIRILATRGNSIGQTGVPEPAPERQFLLGTQFFRPPNPPRAQRREMLRALAQDHGFNLVRLWPNWNYFQPAEDRYSFEELEEVMTSCDGLGLRVLMSVVIETAPYWLEQEHSETRFVDAQGNPQHLIGVANDVTGGWPGLCLDWEPVQQAAAGFIRELARVSAAHHCLYAYDCWNEPHIEPAWQSSIWSTPPQELYCYCEKTRAEFRDWLRRRYETLGGLNEAWTESFPNWEAVQPPRVHGTYPDWVDWRRYMIERSTREMRFRAVNVRVSDSLHILESHATHHPPVQATAILGTNGWRLAEVMEIWGASMFPRWQIPLISLGAAKLEITRANAAGKDFWVTELQSGAPYLGLFASPEMRPRDIRLWNWLALATGAKAIIYWNYLAEATGPEATGFGLVDRDGTPTERVKEAALNGRLIQSVWDIFKDYRPKTQVAILTDQDNALLTYAMYGNEDASTNSFLGYYQALWNMDLWVDFIEPASLSNLNHKVLLAPWHLIGKKGTCDQLASFVRNGGTLILEGGFGMFDERFYYNPVAPPNGLDVVFGYREKKGLAVLAGAAPDSSGGTMSQHHYDRVKYHPKIQFTAPIQCQVKGHTLLVPIDVTSATWIAKCEGMTVAATNKVGRGQVYYIGTNLGASIAAGDSAGMDILRTIVTREVQPPVTGLRLRPRLIEGSVRSLLVVFNDTSEDQREHIKLPSRFRRATDIHRQAKHAVEQNAVHVTVPYQDVVVLMLEE